MRISAFKLDFRKGILGVMVAVTLAGCGEENFKKYVELGDLRILGLVASPPEVDPGANVTVVPWVSDLNNTGALSFSWQACVDPGVNFGAPATCEGNPTATSVQTGTITTLNAGNAHTGAADSFVVAVPATILTSRSAVEQFNGVNYLVIYTLTNASGASVTAVKRLVVSDPAKTGKNQNPTISDVQANGASFTSLTPGTEYQLSATLGATESYDLKRQDGVSVTREEILQTTWFHADGKVKYYRTLGTEPNTYTTPASFPSGRSSFLILSVRDGRGGLAFLRKTVNP